MPRQALMEDRRAAVQALLDDLTLQIIALRVRSLWVRDDLAARRAKLASEKDAEKRHVARRQIQALLALQYFGDTSLVAHENNREFAVLRGEQLAKEN